MDKDSELKFTVNPTNVRYKKYAEALEWWLNKNETLSKLLPTLLADFARQELNLINSSVTEHSVPNTSQKRSVPSQPVVEDSVEEIMEEFLPKEPPKDGQYIINEPGTYCSIHETVLLRQILNLDYTLVEDFCQTCEPSKLGKVIQNVVKFTRSAKVPAVPKELHPRSFEEREAHSLGRDG